MAIHAPGLFFFQLPAILPGIERESDAFEMICNPFQVFPVRLKKIHSPYEKKCKEIKKIKSPKNHIIDPQARNLKKIKTNPNEQATKKSTVFIHFFTSSLWGVEPRSSLRIPTPVVPLGSHIFFNSILVPGFMRERIHTC